MKKFKTLFIAIILICLLTTSVILCAFAPNDNKQCVLALTQFYGKDQNPYITEFFDDESKRNLAEKINSVEELKVFCQEKQLQVFDEDNTKLKYDNVCKKLKEYDETFFQAHSIVLVFRFNETTDYYSFNTVNIKGDVMTVNLESRNGNTYTAMRTQILIYEISKKLAQKVNQIVVEETLGELDQKVSVRIFRTSASSSMNGNISKIVNSTEELNELYTENTSRIFNKDYYNEEFFQNKSIVVLFRFRSSSGHFYRFENCDIDNNAMNILLIEKLPKEPVGYPADVLTCVYLIEIDKDQVSNITNINVEEIEE